MTTMMPVTTKYSSATVGLPLLMKSRKRTLSAKYPYNVPNATYAKRRNRTPR